LSNQCALMRVLLATSRLDLLGGVETAVRDIAIGLGRRGHSAVVYSDDFHKGARPLEAEGVKVIRDMDQLPFLPDIVHGHFSLDTVIALARLPGIPAIFHCHGAGYLGAPLRHPRIYRYVAITPSVAQRVIIESNIEESTMEIFPNSVDLHRFAKLRNPPEQPVRALFYNNYHGRDSKTLAEIRQATEVSGLNLDCIGRCLERRIDNPEDVLPNYDLVFASGRSAIEALACGCAVIIIGMSSCGELVSANNFDRLRRANFSIGANSPPPHAERVKKEIDSYAPDDCATVTERLRSDADSDQMIIHLEGIYDRAISKHRATMSDPVAEHRAVAGYLRKIVPLINMLDEAQTMNGPMPVTASAALQAALEGLRRLYD
jgi:hypothetical protein